MRAKPVSDFFFTESTNYNWGSGKSQYLGIMQFFGNIAYLLIMYHGDLCAILMCIGISYSFTVNSLATAEPKFFVYNLVKCVHGNGVT